MGIFDKFRKKENIDRLELLREWQKSIPIDYKIPADVVEPFGEVSTFSLEQIQANPKEMGRYLFGDDPAPEPPMDKLRFLRILKNEELIDPLKKCFFCNGESNIILIYQKTEYSSIVCCNAHVYDAYATIQNTTLEDAKWKVDQVMRQASQKGLK